MLVGKITRPHGLRGLLRVQSYADSEDSFSTAEAVLLRSEDGLWHEYAVISVNKLGNALVMALAGLDSRDSAQKYQGSEVFIKRGSIPLDVDEYLWADLIGLKVSLDTGKALGNITGIIQTGGSDIFVIKAGTKEYYVPAIHEVVKEIDLKKGRMVILSMEGLLDLNEV